MSDTVVLDYCGPLATQTELSSNEVLWYRINNPATSDLRELTFEYAPSCEEKPQVAVQVFYRNSKGKKIRDLQIETDLVYSKSLSYNKSGDNRIRVTIPDFFNAEYIRLSVRRTILKPELYNCFLLRSNYAVLQKVISFSRPAASDIKFGLENKEGLAVSTNSLVQDGQAVFTVSCNDLQPLGTLECKYPESFFAALFVSFPPDGQRSYSWKQLGNYHLGEFADSLQRADLSFLDSIAATIKTEGEDSAISSAFNFVRDNIRYFGSWEKAYGRIPRDPRTIFTNGYGDCKEMATLLCYLLVRKKVKASLALVCVHDFQYLERYPTLGNFGHMIVCVEKSDGQRLFLDPTNKSSSLKTSCYDYINQKALVLKTDASFPCLIKPDAGYRNEIHTVSRIVRLPDSSSGGGWRMTGTICLLGETAADLFFAIKNRETEDSNKVVSRWLTSALQIKAEKLTLLHVAMDSLVVAYEADASSCVLNSPIAGIVVSMPRLYFPAYSLSDLSYEGGRYLKKIKQVDTWILPEGYGTRTFPDLSEKYGRGSWVMEDSSITRTYENDFVDVDVSEKARLKTFFRNRSAFVSGVVIPRQQ